MSGRKSPEKQSIFDRLTDHTQYTGAHKHRFDEGGKGRGIAGREELVNIDGSTESSARRHAVEKTVDHVERAGRKPVVQGALGQQKFGTQAETPITIWLYRNGDKHFKGVKFIVKKTIRNVEQFVAEAGKSGCSPKSGVIRKIYKQNMKTIIKDITEFEDGEKYLCCGAEKPQDDPEHIPAAFLE
ncbi:unnamed protein product [Vitrella brassicaformis CCMP3155]|uniref:Doublecortin domain-containing protein n=1 Tax=Vitrella brassicaformis (strain CCMP3155) TaxID=1169540 RepID=A0A0G4F4R4_VITBC|nr:unnamed protein product [Vitrella brassicaformis CCMP3155]|eukprot:CEM06711.1 unnamed protein product [Vitrella brassicaformis CCMP3155]